MSTTESNGEKKSLNLFDYTEDQLLHENVLTHYEILGIHAVYASSDDVKKAYRKSSLKYHPDKTGRGDDDYVFLAVKAAYDVLSDHAKRQAYDSTVMPFDDSIPPARNSLLSNEFFSYTDEEFYTTFRPVFERNLQFDARLRPDIPAANGKVAVNKKSLSKKGSFNSTGSSNGKKPGPPPMLGDDNTPIEEVNAFYEYWVRFESWRDFSAQATDELQVENELENAESRFEKRWIQKEIDRRAKQLKRQEMLRIQTLVERAMDADPRLRRERQAEKERKEQRRLERIQEEERKKQDAIRAEQEAKEFEEQEKIRKAEEKIRREQEKKQFRKVKQELRKVASESFSEHDKSKDFWADTYDMNQDIDVIFTSLTVDQVKNFTETVKTDANGCPATVLEVIKGKVEALKNQDKTDAETSNGTANTANGETGNGVSPGKNGVNSTPTKKQEANPWTKEELSALAKAVKKYPPGGGSRWDQIALFVNNLCKQDIPRLKEDCIEKFNQIAKSGNTKPSEMNTNSTTTAAAATKNKNGSAAAAPAAAVSNNNNNSVKPLTPAVAAAAAAAPESSQQQQQQQQESAPPVSSTSAAPAVAAAAAAGNDDWTPEQDQQLQDGLAANPATMDKNERWAKIAQGVPGKSKKDCVQRFKAIREALLKQKNSK